MVDRNLILRKISELETYLSQVREFSDLTLQDYKADWKIQRIVERTLQMIIETCTDIANHIISDTNARPPATYADTFRVLLGNGIISSELFGIMEKMVKFRNIIVPQYEEVDVGIVVVILQKYLADLKNSKKLFLGIYYDKDKSAGVMSWKIGEIGTLSLSKTPILSLSVLT